MSQATAPADIDLSDEDQRHHRSAYPDANGWRLMPQLRRPKDAVKIWLLEPCQGSLCWVMDPPAAWDDAWLIDGNEIVPVAWRPIEPARSGDGPDLTWFEEDPDEAFWTLSPFRTQRICYSQAEGGCWANVGEPTELGECPPEIYRTSVEAWAAYPRMKRRLDRINREEGLRDLGSVLGTYQYIPGVRAGYPKPDEIPTYE